VARDKFDDGFSEMLPAPASHGIGHNMGPEFLPVGKELEDRLKAAHKKPMKRAQDLIDADPIEAVSNPAQLKKATERVRQYQASLTELDGQRKAEKEPYRLGGAQVDGFFNERAEELALLKLGTERLMNAYNSKVAAAERAKRAADLRAKQVAEELARKAAADKLARAEAAKAKARGAKTIAKAAEAVVQAEAAIEQHEETKADVTRAQRQLAAPAADLTRARSANAVQSQQEFVDFRDVVRATVDLEKLRSFLPLASIESAIRQYIASNNDSIKADLKHKPAKQQLAGVDFFMNSRTRVGGGG
jgi:hypothetical protein